MARQMSPMTPTAAMHTLGWRIEGQKGSSFADGSTSYANPTVTDAYLRPYLMLRDVLQTHQKERLERFDVFDKAIAHDFRQRGYGHQSVFLDTAGLVGGVEHLKRDVDDDVDDDDDDDDDWEKEGEWIKR